MFKMDTSTKQVFWAGMFAFMSTVSGLIYHYGGMEIRVEHLEKAEIKHTNDLKLLSSEVGAIQKKNARIEVLVDTLDRTVGQLNKSTIELGKIAARLDERSRSPTN